MTVVTKQHSGDSSGKKSRHKFNVNVLPETYIPSNVPVVTVVTEVAVVTELTVVTEVTVMSKNFVIFILF